MTMSADGKQVQKKPMPKPTPPKFDFNARFKELKNLYKDEKGGLMRAQKEANQEQREWKARAAAEAESGDHGDRAEAESGDGCVIG